MKEPITEDWLRASGFKWHQFALQPKKQWLLWLGACINLAELGRRMALTGPEDLGIEVAPGCDGEWFCWLRSDFAGRYHRFIHLRHIRYTAELVAMIEGITGQRWDASNNLFGSMLHPKHAAMRREEMERLDRKLMRERAMQPSSLK